jgi:glycerol-3-phosphate dehydrogenase
MAKARGKARAAASAGSRRGRLKLVWGVQRDLGSLAGSSFDVLVVGGGIVGACVARDAALRGLRVALIERGDFGGGISWNSLKIVHGGLRSLQGLDIRQARHFVRERRAWLTIAPHLVEPLSFVVPTRGIGRESALVMRAGLALNDLVSSDRNEGVVASRRIADGRTLSRDELRALVPGVFDAYTGGALFHDAQLYSAERLVLAVLEDAVRAGATIANYVEEVGAVRDGGVLAGVSARDALGGESGERFDVRAAMIVNAAGAGAASVAERLTGRQGSATPMAGIALNLMLAGDDSVKTAFAIAASEEGRIRRLFVVPWRGRTLVGTAHYACERMLTSEAEHEPHIERFLREIAAAWPARAITRESVLLVHAGMQPLPHGAPGAKHGPPEHTIIDHAREGAPQLLTAIGPKLTTSRAIAEELVDLVATRVGKATRACETATRPLASAPADDVAIAIARALAGDRAGMTEDVVTYLVRSYGAGYDALLALVRERSALGARIESDSPVIAAQLEHAVRNEMAMRADDLVDRRTELGATARATGRSRAAAEAALAARALP